MPCLLMLVYVHTLLRTLFNKAVFAALGPSVQQFTQQQRLMFSIKLLL